MRAIRLAAVVIGVAGIAVRVHELGRWGFSTDEAWVALGTRAESATELWLALGVSPLGWASLVLGSDWVPAAPEVRLRLVPCLAGIASLWVAYRGGSRFAAHPLGGLFALAVVAFEPLSVGYAKFLKHYTAEVFLCLLAFERAGAYAETGRARDLVILCVVLSAGIPFSHAQLLLGPPLLGALVALAVGSRRWADLRRIAAAAAIVSAVAALYWWALITPRMGTTGLKAYWARQLYLPMSWTGAAELLWTRSAMDLRRFLGPWLVPPALIALGAAAWTGRRRAVIGLGLALLVAELVVLSLARRVPVNQPRVLLFAHVALAAYGAAALAMVGRTVAARVPAVGYAALAMVVAVWAIPHPWGRIGRPADVEEVRAMVRVVERNRQPSDRVLVHPRALFPYAYHQRDAVRFFRAQTGTGFLPAVADPRTAVLRPDRMRQQVIAALRDAPRVWMVGSRIPPPTIAKIEEMLATTGRIVLRRRAFDAFVVLVERAPPG